MMMIDHEISLPVLIHECAHASGWTLSCPTKLRSVIIERHETEGLQTRPIFRDNAHPEQIDFLRSTAAGMIISEGVDISHDELQFTQFTAGNHALAQEAFDWAYAVIPGRLAEYTGAELHAMMRALGSGNSIEMANVLH